MMLYADLYDDPTDEENTVPMYVVIENTPGYLPMDDDPYVTDDYSAAVQYLNDRCAMYADEVDVSGVPMYRVEYGYASSGNYAAAMIWDDSKMHDLGVSIAIELDEE